MHLRRLPPDFSNSAAYPLYAIDTGRERAWVLHFDREDYRKASFLDQRALGHRAISGWEVSRTELEAALQPRPEQARLHWLFHIGHCGSSLVSRLLDLIPGTLGLREPLPLLTLAHENRAASDAWLPIVRGLLARGFPNTRAVVVKPTSIVTTIAIRLLPGTGHACFLWVDLRAWLATLLRDVGLVNAVLSTEDLRLRDLPPLSAATAAPARLARAWLAEQVRWRQLSAAVESSQLVDVDFAHVLADPAGMAGRIATHFGLGLPADWNARIAGAGILDRYAKDASQAFDASTRQRELDAAAGLHSAAIAEGLEWARREIERLELPLVERLQPKTDA